ncbi:MAG TPA: 23S rRNA pseudouridine(1911/1915/1917) synthase RluD [Nevskiaceae bacterium]|nr:23S rRNA pseudouridine(1911/1915/1917) synthase RluD [Nevskiaceae bacterium]
MTSQTPVDGDEELLTAQVPPALAGLRLDQAAAKLFDRYSRARLQGWIESGALTVNGEVQTRSRTPVADGDELALAAEPEVSHEVLPQDIALEVLHADKSIAVINKPAGLTVHPGAGQRDGTLQNALLFRFPQTAKVPRAGIVHRLDKDTSGVLVVALDLVAHAKLVAAISAREVRREYDALVQGTLIAGATIDAPIGRHPHDRVRMAVVERGGREAVTRYRIAERFAHHTLLNVQLETGRTHQIRVHLAHVRHPIVGDAVYGPSGARVRGAGMPPELRMVLTDFRRQALHARELELAHPKSDKAMSFAAPRPGDLLQLLDALRKHDPA